MEMEEEEGETRNEHVSFPRGPVRARALGSPSPSTRHSYPPGDHRRGLTAPGRGACVTLVMRHTSHSFCRAVRAHVRRRVLRSLLSSFGLRSRSRVSERCKILRANRSLAEWFQNLNRECVCVCVCVCERRGEFVERDSARSSFTWP